MGAEARTRPNPTSPSRIAGSNARGTIAAAVQRPGRSRRIQSVRGRSDSTAQQQITIAVAHSGPSRRASIRAIQPPSETNRPRDAGSAISPVHRAKPPAMARALGLTVPRTNQTIGVNPKSAAAPIAARSRVSAARERPTKAIGMSELRIRAR